MRIFGFNITRGPVILDSDKVTQLNQLLEQTLKEKKLESKLHEKEQKKLKASLKIAEKEREVRKNRDKFSRAQTALVHLKAAQRLNRQLEMAPREEVRDAQYNLCILERVVKAKNLGFGVKDKNITQTIDNLERFINGNRHIS